MTYPNPGFVCSVQVAQNGCLFRKRVQKRVHVYKIRTESSRYSCVNVNEHSCRNISPVLLSIQVMRIQFQRLQDLEY
jgi:hypothetical protein